jgi:hypothetical protein
MELEKSPSMSLLETLGTDVPGYLRLGKIALPTTAAFVRELEESDLLMAETTAAGATSQPIKELRQSHHQLARVLAQGVDENEAAIITGYSISRVSILKADPQFSELLEYYRAMEQEQYGVARADMHERLASIGFDSIEVLHQRLVDEPERFTEKMLLAIVEATADRTGHGKTTTVNSNVSHSLSEQALAAIRTGGAPSTNAPPDRSALLRLASVSTAELHSKAEEADGIEGSWREVREEGAARAEEPGPGEDPLPSVD